MKRMMLLLTCTLIVSTLLSCGQKAQHVSISSPLTTVATEPPIVTTEPPIVTTEPPIVTTEKLPEVTTEGEKDTVETTEITTEVPNVTTEDETTDVGVQYKLEITGSSYDLHNEPKQTYAPGEKVTIILNWVTESYHLVYVNGVEVKRDLEANDDWYTFAYYTFIMPSEDVVVNIECVAVSIPEA